MVLPFSSALDVSYTGQHSYNTQNTVNLNSIDLGTAYLPQYQDPTLAPNGVATSLVNTNVNQVRYFTGYGNITQNQPRGVRTLPLDPAVVEPPDEGRLLVRVQRHDQPVRQAAVAGAAAAQSRTAPSRFAPTRRWPTICSATTTRRRTSCAPTSSGSCRRSPAATAALKAIAIVANDWNLAGHLERHDRARVFGQPCLQHRRRQRRQRGVDRLARLRRRASSSAGTPAAAAVTIPTSSSMPRRSTGRWPAASASIRAAAT